MPRPRMSTTSRRAADATLTTLPTCGHVPMLECFAAFNETLSKFVGR